MNFSQLEIVSDLVFTHISIVLSQIKVAEFSGVIGILAKSTEIVSTHEQ